MIKNICKILFRSLDIEESRFTEINIAHSGNRLEISDENTPAGKIYNYKLSVPLQEKAFYRYDGLQFDVVCSDRTHILIGNDNFPAFLHTEEDLDGAEISVEWKDIFSPKFMPVS